MIGKSIGTALVLTAATMILSGGACSGGGCGGDIDFAEVLISGNTFSGSVVPGEGGFAGFDEASAGAVDGVFYGPVDQVLNGPEEDGAALTLQDATSDDFITGVIGASLVD